jgi:hypothetical protein
LASAISLITGQNLLAKWSRQIKVLVCLVNKGDTSCDLKKVDSMRNRREVIIAEVAKERINAKLVSLGL